MKTDEACQATLKFVVHFIGDVNQPLHVLQTSDHSGNNISVYFIARGYNHKSNLQKVWDNEIMGLAINKVIHGKRKALEIHLFDLIDTSFAVDVFRWGSYCMDGSTFCGGSVSSSRSSDPSLLTAVPDYF